MLLRESYNVVSMFHTVLPLHETYRRIVQVFSHYQEIAEFIEVVVVSELFHVFLVALVMMLSF